MDKSGPGGHGLLPAAEGELHSLVEGGLPRAGEPRAGEELLLRNPGEELLLRIPEEELLLRIPGEELLLRIPGEEPGLGSPGEGQLLLVLEHHSPGELGQGSLEEPGLDVPGGPAQDILEELAQDIPGEPGLGIPGELGLGIHLPEAWPLGRQLLGGRTSLSGP